MIRKFVLFLVFGFLCGELFAIEEQNIKSDMSAYIDRSVKIMEEGNSTVNQKASKIFALLDGAFDYELMARLSLGGVWKSLDEPKRKEFAKSFEKALKNSYIDKLELYNGQKIYINDLKKIKSNRIWLNTSIKSQKEDIDIIYKFYQADQKEWFIYDVDIAGVSIIQSYRAQFSDFLKNNTFEKLLDKLSKS